jgi:2-dehydropantoate 2-reductase
MRALVVGAGAVGQVYGRHLARGGAEVAFLVKPAHAARARSGFTLYSLNRPRRQRADPERFTGFEVVTTVAEAAGTPCDQMYLAVSSTALRQGPWLAELTAAMDRATMVLLQPGPDDRRLALAHVPAARLVHGIISLVSYLAPLPGETRFPEPGVAYWQPPLAASPLEGEQVAAVVAALRAGGLAARRSKGVAALAAHGTALLMPVIAALAAEGWSLSSLRRSARLPLALRAARQAGATIGSPTPIALRLAGRPGLLGLALRLAPLLTPFDLEGYLRAHFTKVGAQTRDFLRAYRALAAGAGLPGDALEEVTPR